MSDDTITNKEATENKEADTKKEGGEPNAEPKQPEITDDLIFGELSKRYDGKIKGKEDFEQLLSKSIYDESYIKPKNEFVKKFNDWNGEPEMFITLSKLDPEKMSNKDAMIQDMMLKESLSKEDAAFMYERAYSYLDKSKDDEDFDGDKFKEISIQQNKAAKAAKDYLSQFKISETQKGEKGPDAPDNSKLMEAKKKDWDAPLSEAVKALEKMEFDVVFKNDDKTEESEKFTFATTNAETKKWLEDALVKEPEKFLPNFIKRFAEKGETAYQTLTRTLYELDNRNSIRNELVNFGASKGVARHLESVRPGSVKKTSNGNDTVVKSLAEQIDAAHNPNFQKAK